MALKLAGGVEGGRSPPGGGGWGGHLQTLLEMFFAKYTLLEMFFAKECLGQAPMAYLRALQRSFPALSFAEFRARRFFEAFYQNVQDCLLQAEI